MRIFEQEGKINFVDINDTYVGFSNSQLCCETFGYFFLQKIPDKPLVREYGYSRSYPEWIPVNIKSLIFDTDFFQEQPGDEGGGGFAIFRLINPFFRKQVDGATRLQQRQQSADDYVNEAFLTLYNHHNGYYGHGFSVTHNGIVVTTGHI